MRAGSIAMCLALAACGCALPAIAAAQINTPKPNQGAPSTAPDVQDQPPVPATDPDGDAPIVSDEQFAQEIPPISDDINAPLEPIPPGIPGVPVESPDLLAPVVLASESELSAPLPPLASFDVEPVAVAGVDDEKAPELRYEVRVEGLEEVGLTARFNALSALKEDDDAPNAVVVAARAKEDEGLAVRLLRSIGYYDASASSTIEPLPNETGRVRAVVTVIPGRLYEIGSIAIRAPETVPPGLIERELAIRVGEPIIAERIQGAEANVALKLPQQGYAFAEVGQRDILLDEQTFKGDYTLPVETGPRSSFGGFTTAGDPVFDLEHIGIFARFERGELYDSRKVDDIRQALTATGLFSSIAVEPQRTGRPGPDGTEQVDLRVTQNKGPARTLAGEAGYGTGQGVRLQGSWTHRNLFPPEGALIVSGVAGTLEQGLGVTFRRSNAGRRDRTFSLIANANHSNYEAFESFTGTLGVRWSYESTPIWQKPFTYAFGAEAVGTNEDRFVPATGRRERGTYFIGAIPVQGQWDKTDDLLNPTKGFRIKASVSPEVSLRGSARPYVRTILEGTAYYPINDSFVIAGRLRGSSIAGTRRDDLPPSRRFYAGGGGSVRGFGYQELGPKSEEANPDFDPTDPEEEDPPTVFRPLGGRSVNEAALEVRYRFGNFGVVPFVDAGQVYDSALPKGSDLRMGVGIGGRYYTNFGPFRIDVAMPLNRREGESKLALYLGIGQAF